MAENQWAGSELLVSGRPMDTERLVAKLPRQRDLLLPESLDANRDLRVAERNRPGPEQIAAQKSVEYNSTLITSALLGVTAKPNSAVLIANLTGYIEDQGVAFVDWKVSSRLPGGFHPSKARYISFNLSQQNVDFGRALVSNALVPHWKAGKLATPGFEFSQQPEQLTMAELQSIPGAQAAQGQLSFLKLETLNLNAGVAEINADQKRMWLSVQDEFAEEFQHLEQEHQKIFKNMLVHIATPNKGGESSSNTEAKDGLPDEDPENDETAQGAQHKVWSSMDEMLQEKGELLFDGPSEVSGVNIHITKAKEVILSLSKDKGHLSHRFGTTFFETFSSGGGVGVGVRIDSLFVCPWQRGSAARPAPFSTSDTDTTGLQEVGDEEGLSTRMQG